MKKFNMMISIILCMAFTVIGFVSADESANLLVNIDNRTSEDIVHNNFRLLCKIFNCSCDDWSEIGIDDEYIISNNVWNKGDITSYKQCIFKKDNGLIYGWLWRWPVTDNKKDVKAYPEIIYGWKPWNDNSTTINLPIQIVNIGQIIVSHDIILHAIGIYNMSFDLWITNSSTPNENNITREVMIWLDKEKLEPGGDFIKRVTIGGEDYDFYKTDWDWTYFAFVKVSPKLKGITKIHEFVNYLIQEGYVSTDEYLASIEIGNEIAEGRGNTIIRRYSIEVN